MTLLQLTDKYVWRVLALLLGTMVLSGCISGEKAFSYATQAQGNALCSSLYGEDDLHVLASKMPLLPGVAPNRAMLSIPDAPSDVEVKALRLLENASRQCKALRAASGLPTTASEDILEARVSKLRYALYSGRIPYGVYNYGLVQALKKHTEFLVAVEEPYSAAQATGALGPLNHRLSSALGELDGRNWSCSERGCY